jgi:hypothetical protein
VPGVAAGIGRTAVAVAVAFSTVVAAAAAGLTATAAGETVSWVSISVSGWAAVEVAAPFADPLDLPFLPEDFWPGPASCCAGMSNFVRHWGQTPRLPARNDLRFMLCPHCGHVARIPMTTEALSPDKTFVARSRIGENSLRLDARRERGALRDYTL